MVRILSPILLLVVLFPSITMGESDNGSKIVGTWMKEDGVWKYHYTFEKSGKLLIKNMSKDGKTWKYTSEGAYVFQDNYCYLRTQPNIKGNMMIYRGSSHCCYQTRVIADMLIFSSLGDSLTCDNMTLKRQK